MINDGTPEYRFDRFQPPGPGDEPRPLVLCAECDEYIREGDEAARTCEDEYVHDECLAEYLRERYVLGRGVICAGLTIE